LELGANWSFQLHGDRQAFRRARAAILDSLRRHSRRSGSKLLPPSKERRRRRAL
jgi:hypothetical protein